MTTLIRAGLLALGAVLLAAGCGGSSDSLPDSFVIVRSQDNPIIPADSTFTELVRLELEPGRYEVAGKVELHNRDGVAPFNVQCGLVPSNADGSPGEPGGLASDWGFRHLGPFGGAGELSGIVLFVSHELDSPGHVVLGCEGSGSSDRGAFTAYSSIRAIEVGSITTSRFTP
jgi:hypothetical protein